MAVSERFLWAKEFIKADKDDTILEIGCGAGILVEQLAQEVKEGYIVAIDKSAPMLAQAAKRNKKFIDEGKVILEKNDFANASFPAIRFDKIVSFNVNFFWKKPKNELDLIKEILAPDGKVFIFYQMPYHIDIKAADPIIKRLKENSFKVEQVELKEAKHASFCIVAKKL